MKRNYAGCGICDSTWGDHWEEVEGERTFFCCSICADQFRGLLERIRGSTGWPSVDEIEIHGDRGGRTCSARAGDRSITVRVAFTPDGRILSFERVPSA